MKTTIDIADNLLLRGKNLARELNVTLRTLIEEGLEHVINRRSNQRTFKFKQVTFKGKGIRSEYEEGDWSSIRDAAYKGRGS